MDVNNYDLNSLLQFLKETNEEEIKFKTKICTQKEEIVKTENVINQFQNCLNQQNEMLSRLSTDHDNVKHRKNKLMQAIMQLDNENEADSSYDSNVNSINVSVNQKVLSENEDKLQNFTFNNEKDLKRNIEGNNKKLTIPNIGETSENKKRKIEESNNCTKNISLNETKSGNETFIERKIMAGQRKFIGIFENQDKNKQQFKDSRWNQIVLEEEQKKDKQNIAELESKLKRWEHSFVRGDEFRNVSQRNLFLEKTNTELQMENQYLRTTVQKEILEQERFKASQILRNELVTMKDYGNEQSKMMCVEQKDGLRPMPEVEKKMRKRRNRPGQRQRRAFKKSSEYQHQFCWQFINGRLNHI